MNNLPVKEVKHKKQEMKRFTETSKWTANKWFRKLPNKMKLLWLYVLDNCDSVGVWHEDIELVGLLLREEYELNECVEAFGDRVYIFENGKKWWIKDFIQFQYGALNKNCKPHQSYLSKLDKHGLMKGYLKGINTLQEKEKEKEKEKEQEKDLMGNTKLKKHFAEFVTLTDDEFTKLCNEHGEGMTRAAITVLDNYKGAKGKRYKSDYRAILSWAMDEAVKRTGGKTSNLEKWIQS